VSNLFLYLYMAHVGIPVHSQQMRICLSCMTDVMPQAALLQSFTEQITLPALHVQSHNLTCDLPFLLQRTAQTCTSKAPGSCADGPSRNMSSAQIVPSFCPTVFLAKSHHVSRGIAASMPFLADVLSRFARAETCTEAAG